MGAELMEPLFSGWLSEVRGAKWIVLAGERSQYE